MTEQSFETMRRAMIASQLRTTGVNDPRVLAAIGAVAREAFVPAARADTAYAEAMVPIGEGRALNPPMTLGRLIVEARPSADETALVIGAGTGYSAAVLDRLTASVVAVEENPALAGQARAALAGTDVTLVEGPAREGHKAGAPYDVILIDGAVEFVPQMLVEQLAATGRLVTAIVDNGVTRLAVGRRGGVGFALVPFADAETAILPGFEKPREFSF